MLQNTHVFPPLPRIGLSEGQYARLTHEADAQGNHYAHEASKVGQYITLALEGNLDWPAKSRYFQHALKRHCVPPAVPDESVWVFYRSLADLVRQYAGAEALRLASAEDDMWAARVGLGSDRNVIECEAEIFFAQFFHNADKRPDMFSEEDWAQLKLIRDQWI